MLDDPDTPGHEPVELGGGFFRFSGRVTNQASGNGIEDVLVEIFPGSGRADTTDTEGRFQISNAPRGSWEIAFVPMYNTAFSSKTQQIDISGETNREVSLYPGTPSVVDGFVRYAGSAIPLQGVPVFMQGFESLTSSTASDGHYFITGICQGYYNIIAIDPLTFRQVVQVPSEGLKFQYRHRDYCIRFLRRHFARRGFERGTPDTGRNHGGSHQLQHLWMAGPTRWQRLR